MLGNDWGWGSLSLICWARWRQKCEGGRRCEGAMVSAVIEAIDPVVQGTQIKTAGGLLCGKPDVRSEGHSCMYRNTMYEGNMIKSILFYRQ